MKSWIMFNVECRIECGNQREKGWHLVVIPVPTPLPFPLASSVTQLVSRCSLYMFPYSSELLDTFSSTQAN